VIRKGEERKEYKILVGNPEGKRPLGRVKRRREDGIRMEVLEVLEVLDIGWGEVQFIHLP
jgi:hypothetical protein